MRTITKNILVYKNGQVEVLKEVLMGAQFIKPEMVNGDYWLRTFDVKYVDDPTVLDGGVAVAIESSFEMKYDAAEVRRRDEEFRERVMKQALWGIRNYPGEGSDT